MEVKNNLRVIHTGRDIESINKAAKNGYWPLIKKIEPSDAIQSKYAVLQHKRTGRIYEISDFRSSHYDVNHYELVIDFTFYYPYQFLLPYAAYLIPNDLKKGERIFLKDLIEDYIGATWNQGDTYRLESCEAIWNGKDFEIQYNPTLNRQDFIG